MKKRLVASVALVGALAISGLIAAPHGGGGGMGHGGGASAGGMSHGGGASMRSAGASVSSAAMSHGPSMRSSGSHSGITSSVVNRSGGARTFAGTGAHVNRVSAADLQAGRSRLRSVNGRSRVNSADQNISRRRSNITPADLQAGRSSLRPVSERRVSGVTTAGVARTGGARAAARNVDTRRWAGDWSRFHRGPYNYRFFRRNIFVSPWFLFPFSFWYANYDPCWSYFGGFRYYCFYDNYPWLLALIQAGQIAEARAELRARRAELDAQEYEYLEGGLDQIQQD